MSLSMSEDPYEVKRSLGGNGARPAGLRNISMNDAAAPIEKPPIYVTGEGIASTDPNVGQYNRAAMRAASTAGQAEAAAPGVAAAAESAAPAAASRFGGVMAAGRSALGSIPAGLRTLGTGLVKAVAPAVLARTAADVATTDTGETDTRLKALGLDTSTDVGKSLDDPNPGMRALKSATRYGSVPFIGPVLEGLANVDPQLGADVETRGKQAVMSGLGLNGIADRKAASLGLRTTPATPGSTVSAIPNLDGSTSAGGGGGQGGGPGVGSVISEGRGADGLEAGQRAAIDAALSKLSLRGSIVAPGGGAAQTTTITAGNPQGQAAQTGQGGPQSPATDPSDALNAEIQKVGSNVYKGVRGGNFYGEAGGTFTNNIANELNQRAKVKALQDKYGVDATIMNNRANLQLRAMELGQTIASKNQDELKGMFDRTATVPTLDKNGQQTGTTVDPALRNRAEDFARSAVAGWDHLSPEQRSQGFEGVRHKFLLQELANSGDSNALGKFLSWTGIKDQLGGYTAQPLKVKSVRSLGVGDLGQKSAALTSVVSGRPYVEFENGKLYPLQDVVNTPELKSAFEARLGQSSKLAQAQYKKYVGGR